MSNELTIKLSEIRECTGNRSMPLSLAKAVVANCRHNEVPLGLIICEDEQAILQNAPNKCVEELVDISHGKVEWAASRRNPGHRRLSSTYRLHSDVKVVDDTAEGGEYQFVEVYPVDIHRGGIMWSLRGRSEPVLADVTSYVDYICTEVEDADGQRGFVRNWQGPSTQEGFESIELVGRILILRSPLTPKNVVFRPKGKLT